MTSDEVQGKLLNIKCPSCSYPYPDRTKTGVLGERFECEECKTIFDVYYKGDKLSDIQKRS